MTRQAVAHQVVAVRQVAVLQAARPRGQRWTLRSHGAGEKQLPLLVCWPPTQPKACEHARARARTHTHTHTHIYISVKREERRVCLCQSSCWVLALPVKCLLYKQVAQSLIPSSHVLKQTQWPTQVCDPNTGAAEKGRFQGQPSVLGGDPGQRGVLSQKPRCMAQKDHH